MNLKISLKKLKHSILAATVIMGSAVNVFAAQVEQTVGVFFDQVQATSNYNSNTGEWGIQTYNNKAGLNASGHATENLVLEMDMYVQNLDNPGNLDFIFDGNAKFNGIEVANEISDNKTWKSWSVISLKDVNGDSIKAGVWQHYRLKLSEARGGADFDPEKTINYFRWCIAKYKAETIDSYQIRFKDIKLVDSSILVDDTTIDQNNTTRDAANFGDFAGTIILSSKNYNGGNIRKVFDPVINVADHNPKMLYLEFDADITEGAEGDIMALKKAPGQIEVTSSGKNDVEELCFGINVPDWKVGKHTYSLPFSTAGVTGGAIDYSRINYIRIYAVHIEEAWNIDNLTIAFSNFKIIDKTNDTKLPTIFSDGMMFQQKKPINIWGFATNDKEITVNFYKGETLIATQKSTVVDGRWDVSLPALVASFDKYHFDVLEGESVIQTVNDILVGEVWVAGGQSNMALNVSGTQQASQLMADADNDNIRFLYMPTYPYSGNGSGEMPKTPTADIAGAYWGHGDNGVQVGSVSAVAYIAIKELQQKLNIPVGFLYTPIGGSVIEAWIPRQEIDEDTEFVIELSRRGLYYDENFWVNNSTSVTALYNQKVGPLAGFNVAGTIWYQGESNSNRPELYAKELTLLKKGWERTFNFEEGTMPFVFCQVGRWVVELDKPQYLAYLDEAMYDGWANSESSRNTMSLLPIYDTDMTYVGNVVIHPTNKIPVGNRFANAMYNLVYDENKSEYTAPVFEELNIDGQFAIVKFSHVGEGLKTIEGCQEVRGFAICDSRGIYVNANARIYSNDEVLVWSDGISTPTNVTYAFSTFNFTSNLCNSENIPAAPFRSSREENQTYCNPTDWTSADVEEVWAITSKSPEAAGYVKTWVSENANLSFDTDNKFTGTAALKVSYDAAGEYNFGPNSEPLTVVYQFGNYNYMSAYVYNPDNRAKTISVSVKDSEGTKSTVDYTLNANAATRAAAIDEWQYVVFDLSTIGKEKLDSAKDLIFTVKDTEAGSINIDNVTFGLEQMVLTGVDNIEVSDVVAENADPYYYDLVGRRYIAPTAAGIYIHAGKKVLINK